MSVPGHVWYAAYGSNVSADRFRVYITGGQPDGANRAYPGCRDHEPPTGDHPIVLPHMLYFAGESTTWGGGVAFIDPERDAEERTLGRIYRVSWQQLEDIVAQENGKPRGSVQLDDTVLREGAVELDDGWYSCVLRVAYEWGEPYLEDDEYVLTITGPKRSDYAPPPADYLRHIVSGLASSHGFPLEHILEYLRFRPGIKERFTLEDLSAACAPSTGEGG